MLKTTGKVRMKRVLLSVFCLLTLFISFYSPQQAQGASKVATVKSKTIEYYQSVSGDRSVDTYWRDIYYTDYCMLEGTDVTTTQDWFTIVTTTVYYYRYK